MTRHSICRVHERVGLNEESAMKMIQKAKERGKTAERFPARERQYLNNKSKDGSYAIYYAGYCFILNSEGVCITVFATPIWFGKRNQYYRKTEIRNRKRYLKNHPEMLFRFYDAEEVRV